VTRAALVLVLVMAGVASAGPNVQKEADVLFEKGQASYQAGKYQDAIAQFKEAYELVKDPVYLFNIAQSYRKVADCTAAAEYYKRYLEKAPNAENKQKVEQWLEELRPCVQQRERDQESARKSAEEAERLRRERELAAASGIVLPQNGTLDRGKPYRYGGLVLVGVGVVGIAVGIGFSVKGSSIKSDIDKRCSPPNSCQWDSEEIQALHRDGESANTWTKVGYITGGIAIVGGAALYMYGRTRIENVSLAPGPGGATVSARFKF
jgi:tetratricopeptide (TPR) repeat protein